ncbi:UDP-N-acetylmuramoyl-L-alanyl-D-glutamate--2,6-diaminopimelate ligase [candidate division KSB1 bacterium]|nr:MAG: UDP-N-acetylmuramoyl-L-alanyl-D-glutamate--2,6-diaminopimelate ligase [candidate division KSB1 bacterium]
MKNLKELISKINPLKIRGNINLPVKSLHFDSRKIKSGDLFIAVKGVNTDGHNYINKAIERGAVAVVYEKGEPTGNATFIRVKNTRQALSIISDNFFGSPSKKMKYIGITGTNGKTTTSFLVKSIFDSAGIKSGMLGTIYYNNGEKLLPAQLTTPEPVFMHKCFQDMYLNGCSHCILEVSSHSLSQDRVYSIEFSTAVITSISRDHLDYHHTLKDYINTKAHLFDLLKPGGSTAIINADLDSTSLFYSKVSSSNILKYSLNKDKGDIYPVTFTYDDNGTSATIGTPEGKIKLESKLAGNFQLYNLMAATGVAIANGVSLEKIVEGVKSLKSVPGRLERVDLGQNFTVFIDYAHTPDAMEKVLSFTKKVVKGRIIALFGCGGNRDKGKRPEMGRIAEEYSDFAIVTSDNPRKENPFVIIDQILTGIKNKNKVEIQVDRKTAIKTAINLAEKNDIVLILGKGHENYQVIGDKKIEFDDRVVASEFIRKRLNKNDFA